MENEENEVMTTKCPKCGAYLSKNESLLGNCVSCGLLLKIRWQKRVILAIQLQERVM